MSMAGQSIEGLLIDDRDALAAPDPAVGVEQLGTRCLPDLERVWLACHDQRGCSVDAALDNCARLPCDGLRRGPSSLQGAGEDDTLTVEGACRLRRPNGSTPQGVQRLGCVEEAVLPRGQGRRGSTPSAGPRPSGRGLEEPAAYVEGDHDLGPASTDRAISASWYTSSEGVQAP